MMPIKETVTNTNTTNTVIPASEMIVIPTNNGDVTVTFERFWSIVKKLFETGKYELTKLLTMVTANASKLFDGSTVIIIEEANDNNPKEDTDKLLLPPVVADNLLLLQQSLKNKPACQPSSINAQMTSCLYCRNRRCISFDKWMCPKCNCIRRGQWAEQSNFYKINQLGTVPEVPVLELHAQTYGKEDLHARVPTQVRSDMDPVLSDIRRFPSIQHGFELDVVEQHQYYGSLKYVDDEEVFEVFGQVEAKRFIACRTKYSLEHLKQIEEKDESTWTVASNEHVLISSHDFLRLQLNLAYRMGDALRRGDKLGAKRAVKGWKDMKKNFYLPTIRERIVSDEVEQDHVEFFGESSNTWSKTEQKGLRTEIMVKIEEMWKNVITGLLRSCPALVRTSAVGMLWTGWTIPMVWIGEIL
ncbi:hypothetical protein IV203_009868 [Nitzschia inconspicua]|uniref:Uncharacterized protein n=1 Tax=Nitzschia inconspicua TaxID=303405 RepID=A0A9K3KWL6_9STRA|nr:hypothetical protein IV203_009868 [Nitzschia inconspicua]